MIPCICAGPWVGKWQWDDYYIFHFQIMNMYLLLFQLLYSFIPVWIL